tara:strand:- start:259 stop:432 length:174 start_codon:yes stop_codon:yes gene_type:complete
MSIYLGSKIFKGTVVLGKIIKLLKGKTGILLGKSEIFISLFYTSTSNNTFNLLIKIF